MNNFCEATIRILKDIVLSRMKAFNAVALLDFVASVWEEYFKTRILSHAYNRAGAHKLSYDKLLKSLPEDVAGNVTLIGDSLFKVPSATGNVHYEVCSDIGMCTCPNGQQGAFCKHQALVHKTFGGSFANAPALTTQDRRNLGELALGDKCPPIEFFTSFAGPEEASTSAASQAVNTSQEHDDRSYSQPLAETSTSDDQVLSDEVCIL